MKNLNRLIRLVFALSVSACNSHQQKAPEKIPPDTGAIERSIAETPVLSPQESIARMKIADGFEVKEVASEPMISAPVALTFDAKGRIWAAEMQGYMPDTVGQGENTGNGKIVILEDTNHDGRMDTRSIFLDKLVLPRALCLVENGILIAEPPTLSFYPIDKKLQAGKRVIIDSAYALGGNPEHQPNGLFHSLDNWIYSADCEKRYRKYGNKWVTDHTNAKGQWGISQDDLGRLFYNNNSKNLLGDYFPAVFSRNEDMPGFNETIVSDNRVFPIRPTPGVNRGYMEGILDDSLRLINFTAASGPVIYRGAAFGKDYEGNAFVPEPAANLVKRDIINDSGFIVTGKEAWQGKEFIASTDERFRPVTAYNGPDGALYLVDMYRGIIQHKTYLTDYLKSEIRRRNLSSPLNCGRIYKVIHKNSADTVLSFPADPQQLMQLLGHKNGWIRDKAQQLIVDGKYIQLIPTLKKNIQLPDGALLAIHSFWTLEGVNALKMTDIISWLNSKNPQFRMQAFAAVPSLINKNNYRELLAPLEALMKDSVNAIYTSFLVEDFKKLDTAAADELIRKLRENYPVNKYITASIDNLQNKDSRISNKLRLEFPKGFQLFNTVCKTCHGDDGNGKKSLAPPLNGSEWVNGNKDTLINIVLNGLNGPVKVKGKLYQSPEIAGEMPGIGNNPEITDEQIAQALSMIRRAWANKAPAISAADIKRLRKK